MWKKIALVVIVLALVLLGMTRLKSRWPGATWGVICESAPRFEDFGEKVIPDRLLKVDVDNNTMARDEMRSEMLAATGSAVNFSGKYVLVEKSCGLNCQKHVVINVSDGKLPFFGLQTSHSLNYRADSRLVMTNPTGKNKSVFYEFKDSQLNYLCETEKQ
jgi:hypothetical protein